jgi:hypothetical protein
VSKERLILERITEVASTGTSSVRAKIAHSGLKFCPKAVQQS